jgi:hypothetical protein
MPPDRNADRGAARNHVRLFMPRILANPKCDINNSAHRRRYGEPSPEFPTTDRGVLRSMATVDDGTIPCNEMEIVRAISFAVFNGWHFDADN